MNARILAALLTAAAFALPAAAQEMREEQPKQQTLAVDFAGGTLMELVQAIQSQGGPGANIIVSAEAAKVHLPPMTLRGVTVRELAEALQALGEIDGSYLRTNAPSPNLTAVSATPVRESERRDSEIFNLTGVTEDYSIDDIVTSIKTAWAMMSADPAAELKYHAETRLLIAVGTQKELKAVDDVVRELRNAVRARMETIPDAERLAAMIAELRTEVAELKNQVQELQKSPEKAR